MRKSVSRRDRLDRSVVLVAGLAACLVVVSLFQPIIGLVLSTAACGVLLRRVLGTESAIAASLTAVGLSCLVASVVGGISSGFGVMTSLGSSLVLALPVIVIGAVLRSRPSELIEHLWGGAHGDWRARASLVSAAALGPLVLLVAAFVAVGRFGIPGLAWAMSGDARNHVLLVRQIERLGGIDQQLLSWYPPLPNAVIALVSHPLGSGEPSPSDRLVVDIVTLSAVLAVAIVATSILFSATVALVVPPGFRMRHAAIAAASLAPLSGAALGVALRDGFVSAVISMPFLAAGLLLLLAAARIPHSRWLLISFASFSVPVIAASWTVVAPPIAAGVASVALVGWRAGAAVQRRTFVIAGGLCLVLTTVVVAPLALAGTASTYVARPGSIVPPSPEVFIVIVGASLLGSLAFGSARGGVRVSPYASATLVVVLLVGYAVALQPAELPWGYYPAKLAWMWICVSLPLVVAAAAIALGRLYREPQAEHAMRGWLPPFGRVVDLGTTVVFVVVVWFGLEALSPLPSPVLDVDPSRAAASSQIAQGWNQPNQAVVRTVIDLSKNPGPYVIWNYLDPGNDRLGNFWLDVLDPPAPVQSTWPISTFANWAYFEVPGDPTSLCELVRLDPTRRPYPATPDVQDEVSACVEGAGLR